MENFIKDILNIYGSGITALLVSFAAIFSGTISKVWDILDLFVNIQNDVLNHTFTEYLLKKVISDKKNIIKLEYQLNNEWKSIQQELDKHFKNDFTFMKDYELKIQPLISKIKFQPSRQRTIPIKMLCAETDVLWVQANSDIKINSELLEELYKDYIRMQAINKGKEILLNQSKIAIFSSFIQKQKRSNLFLNAGLYKAFARRFLSTIQIKESKENVSDTLIGVMLNKKAKTYTRSFVFLLLPIILFALLSILTDVKIEPLLIYANIFFLASTLINQKILEFRIAKGYYGSNEYEAREMLRFVAENSDGTNFSDGTGLMPFPAEDMTKFVWIEGCVTI